MNLENTKKKIELLKREYKKENFIEKRKEQKTKQKQARKQKHDVFE